MFDWIRRTWRTKTFKVCVGGILIAIGGAFEGSLEWSEAITTCVILAAQLMLRDASAKAKQDVVSLRLLTRERNRNGFRKQ